MAVLVSCLTANDAELAAYTASVMAQVFDEDSGAPRSRIEQLLAEDNFWLLAAIDEDKPVGGLTAQALPMTKEASRELVLHVCKLARAEGISVAYVPADNEDQHALDFYRAIGGQFQPVTFFNFEL